MSDEGLIVGVDLALRVTAWVAVRGDRLLDSDIIETLSGSLGQRYRRLYDGLREAFKRWHPDHIVLETPTWAVGGTKRRKDGSYGPTSSTRTIQAMFGALAIAQMAAADHDALMCRQVNVHLVDPTHIKWAIAGDRAAPKEAVRRALALRGDFVNVDISKLTTDQTDALALAKGWALGFPLEDMPNR